MKYFKLPDLGEGLQEAEIVEWFVEEGQEVKVDQPLLSLETDKAIVTVPSPESATISKLMGESGDVIHTGEVLVEFSGEDEDSGTVVGRIKPQESKIEEDSFVIGAIPGGSPVQKLPSTTGDTLENQMGLKLCDIKGTGKNGLLTSADLESAWKDKQASRHHPDRLRGVRRHMAIKMKAAREQVTPVTLFDEADIHAWSKGQDITVRLIQAIIAGCKAEPGVNAWYDGEKMTYHIHDHIDLGIAVDTEDGLFVPVLRDIAERKADNLRQGLNFLRDDVKKRSIPQEELRDATITLSNFGMIAGTFATPIVVPPMVCIIGAGSIYERAVVEKGKVVAHRTIPLSVTIDHQVLTGGEAARFLAAVKEHLAQK